MSFDEQEGLEMDEMSSSFTMEDVVDDMNAELNGGLDEMHDGNEVDKEEDDEESEYETDDDDDEDDRYVRLTMADQAHIVMAILKPVSVTMLLVVCSIYFLSIPVDNAPSSVWLVYQEQSSDSTTTKVEGAILDAVIFVVMIVLATFLLVCCFKYRCMCFIYGWLILSTWMLLATLGSLVFYFMIDAANIAVDAITFALIMWNFSVGGMVCVFWYAPAFLTQSYLVLVSALMVRLLLA